ncbi:MAG TPA: hypothetical protein P5031_07620 [Candidatus Syntrophosphaera sp.]|nr:hypothetical protein [Candidatus Syntrophosphaera sp.]
MRDFTLKAYTNLLKALKESSCVFHPFSAYLNEPAYRVFILRHDVDKMPQNALDFARLEHEMGISASYYFRIVPQSFNPKIIKEIASLGHEIGYHYEDMDLCKGDVDKSYASFQKNLAKLREIAPIQTVCMHGSPLSKYDNRDLWKKYDYRELGIIGEPYFDIDYSKVFYLTDTGRKWNSTDTSIRDKVASSFHIEIRNTQHLIQLIREGKLPDQVMINTHPQRWNDNLLLWTRELFWQTIKNQGKKIVVRWWRGGVLW